MNRKVMVSLSGKYGHTVPGWLIGWAAVPPVQVERVSGSKVMESVDALVLLESFDKGAVWQFPLAQIKCVEEWDSEIEEREKRERLREIFTNTDSNPYRE